VAKLSVAIERTDSPYPNYLQSPCKLIIKSAKFPEDLKSLYVVLPTECQKKVVITCGRQ